MSKIISPVPLVITITVNEMTGEIKAVGSRPMPHISLIAIALKVCEGWIQDSLRQAQGLQNQYGNPGANPGGNPGGIPGGSNNATQS